MEKKPLPGGKSAQYVRNITGQIEPSGIIFTQQVGSNPWHQCPTSQFVVTLAGAWYINSKWNLFLVISFRHEIFIHIHFMQQPLVTMSKCLTGMFSIRMITRDLFCRTMFARFTIRVSSETNRVIRWLFLQLQSKFPSTIRPVIGFKILSSDEDFQ